ncbi:MAG: baseplate multidomain protein megatron [Henriciella sp.]
MAQLVLSQVGAAIGGHLLPQGLPVFGQAVSGAALGGALGGMVGQAVDASLAPPRQGPRLQSLHLMDSREGAGLALVYGRMRVAGQLIWASRFREHRQSRSVGKGTPKQVGYTYTVSLAVAICQGKVTRLGRVWANGDPLDLGTLTTRFYTGAADQLADPLIEAIEGTGQAPAYRDTAYIVFEDLPLGPFGNRLPNLSFEVFRAGSSRPGGLRRALTSINIIPATGEFVYATVPVRERRFPATERPLNLAASAQEADFRVSLEQVRAELPALEAATLQVAWFGDDLRAGQVRIRPGVETRQRDTVPYAWRVAGQDRSQAYLVSQNEGRPNYGGTPADQAVLEGLEAMVGAGLAPTLSPFLLMDIPPGSTRPAPQGGGLQPAFPWRGRLSSAADGQAAVRADIAAFMGDDGAFGYRHFILHYARLGATFGRLEAFLIGSELIGLTRLRDEAGRFPFVEALEQLAAEVRAILGPGVKLSYAADWTEYGAWSPAGGSDLLFPLDPLWASPDIDFVAVDWYPPLTDWRDGDQHLDALAGFQGAADPNYLRARMISGEAYDWYYASGADREAQIRTPIHDSAHGEHWVFRPKDLSGWWSSTHFPRTGGQRATTPTAWVAAGKPVRLAELGCPAVDRGGNAPNRFLDLKSDESALPPYSDGQRDDLVQRHMLEAALAWAATEPAIEAVSAWCWDARPWPAFPERAGIWSDGGNWARGHWLNGRVGLISLAEVIKDVLSQADLVADVSRLHGLVEGLALGGPLRLREALAPLMAAYDLICLESGFDIVFRPAASDPSPLELTEVVADSQNVTHRLLDKAPWALQLSYISTREAYAPAVAEARRRARATPDRAQLDLPLVLNEAWADRLAHQLLGRMVDGTSLSQELGPTALPLEPGDSLHDGEGRIWQVRGLVDRGVVRQLDLVPARAGLGVARAADPPGIGAAPVRPAEPDLLIIDGPRGSQAALGPLLACSASPWPGPIEVRAGPGGAVLTRRALCERPARRGQSLVDVPAGPLGRWDMGPSLQVDLPGADLASVPDAAVLAGANQILVETETGWERIGFGQAQLMSSGHWALSRRLRGLEGSPVGAIQSGAPCVLLDDELPVAALAPAEIGLDLTWQAGAAPPRIVRFEDQAGRALRVGHLRAVRHGPDWRLSWTRRGRDVPGAWMFPEAANEGRFRLRVWRLDGSVVDVETRQDGVLLEGEVRRVEIAEMGPDGRTGRWVSIQLPPE